MILPTFNDFLNARGTRKMGCIHDFGYRRQSGAPSRFMPRMIELIGCVTASAIPAMSAAT